MNENKNLILAVVLSALVLLGWSLLSEQFVPSNAAAREGRGRQGEADCRSRRPARSRRLQRPFETAPSCFAKRRASASRLRSLQGSINLKGARIDDLVLLRERQGIAKDSPPVRLLSPAGAPQALFRHLSDGAVRAFKRRRPIASGQPARLSSSPGRPVTLSWTNPTGQRFEIIYLGRRRLSLHGPAAGRQSDGQQLVAVRPFGLDQPRRQVA